MKFFRINHNTENNEPSTGKSIFWAGVMLLIVFSFFWQMSLGLCPVP